MQVTSKWYKPHVLNCHFRCFSYLVCSLLLISLSTAINIPPEIIALLSMSFSLSHIRNVVIYRLNFPFLQTLDLPCCQSLEYTNCIPLQRSKNPTPPPRKKGSIILNWIWLWDSSSGNLRIVEYLFIALLTLPAKVLSVGQIDLFENYLYSRRLCTKKQLYKKFKYEHRIP